MGALAGRGPASYFSRHAAARAVVEQSTPPPTTYTIGGTISGLSGTGLVLQDNGGDNLQVGSTQTTFTFATAVASGAAYAVTVLTQPSSPAQTCTVTNGTPERRPANVTIQSRSPALRLSPATYGHGSLAPTSSTRPVPTAPKERLHPAIFREPATQPSVGPIPPGMSGSLAEKRPLADYSTTY